MKLSERVNLLLLGTLWTLAIVLILDFWLNTAYNFNIFSSDHWKFVSNLQATNQHIASGFYVAIILAVVACITGLYVLFRPKFRKIELNQPTKPTSVPQPTQQPIQKPEPVQQPNNIAPAQPVQPNIQKPVMQRPPHLHIQMPQNPPRQPVTNTNPQPSVTTKPKHPELLYVDEMRAAFDKNGYKVLSPKIISGTPLSLIALGTNETLWLGAANISHEQMTDIILSFKKIFQETLEDIEIDINSFIINPTDTDSVDAILDLKTIEELPSAIANIPNAPESEFDKESDNMNAFAGYIETVLTYLGNK